ncbi:asparaginase [Candidatus Galacturonibacter soehngenii]|uniref:asparaginase n=1 Tax=Candidatus Galacturonatibacter soehngenii TaxID=2307010 RepID=A0A7V7UAU8_9FIRM|nr:asparaginase [Candidatus Galacturonibacter soehngenii]KAB1436073.1 asparaginase [Candidatus Galacturonibacter soehngenii]
MKKILLIATGGTIASSESEAGLLPTIDAKQILEYIPDIESICHLTGISIMSIDSTNMNPKRMVRIAEAINDNYKDYDGFVVTHGTDTMGYTAAALTYMLENVNKPVVLTGSQIAIEAMNTDAKKNLSDAIRFSCEELRGVFVAFDGKMISGTHAVKMKTRSMDSFKSINFPAVADIMLGKITVNSALNYGNHWEKLEDSNTNTFQIKTNLCENIFILKLFPGMKPSIFSFIKENYKGVIIESFGIGGIPSEEYDIVLEVSKLIEAGIAVVITTQCLYEGIDLNIYAVGKRLAKQEVIYAADMTTEALSMKLMWALGNYQNLKDVKQFIETPIFADRNY